jgi:hypothetical protein
MTGKNRLDNMKGKTFMYKLEPRTIIDFKITDEEVFISTDINLISFKIQKAETELNQFLPAETKVPTELPKFGLVKFAEDAKWSKLKDTAYTLIDKLNQTDGDKYIGIANATNQTINSMVNIMKIEIEAVRLMKK